MMMRVMRSIGVFNMSQKEKITVVLSGVNEKVHKVLEKSGFYELLGEENICPNINVALERAKKLL